MEATSNPTFKNFFHQLSQHLLQNHQKCQIILCPTHQQQNHFLPGWLSLLSVYGQSCLPKLLPIILPSNRNNSDSSSTTPSSKASLFASVTSPHHFPPSKFTMSPIKFFTRKVRQTLLQLDTSKSRGPDGIPAIVLKTCAPELAPILNKLFQLSYTLGTFPTSWKQAHVFPIPKKGDKSNPLNYRPIAITSLISKTMETIITKQLLTFLETNNLLSDHLYDFRKARSTGDLLAYAVHVWSSALESSGESRVISLDISKAFDRVWHKGLLAKLPMSGLHHTLIK